MAVLIFAWTYLLAAAIAVVIIRDARQGRIDLVCTRNLILLGSLVFLVLNAPTILNPSYMPYYHTGNPAYYATKYLSWTTVFIAIFLLSYRYLKPIRERDPEQVPAAPIGDFGTLAIAIALSFLAIALRFGVRLPLVGTLTNLFGVGLAAVAAGLGGWVWGKRFFNPAAAAMALTIVLVNVVATQFGSYGRRNLVSVGGAMLWGLWFSSFRYLPLRSAIPRLALVAAIPIFGLAVLTGSRHFINTSLTGRGSPQSAIASAKDGFEILTAPSDTAKVAAFVMQYWQTDPPPLVAPFTGDGHAARPGTRPLFSIQYFIMYPIPRAFWKEKPYPMSTYTADMARRRGVKLGRSGVTNPAGVVGNAAAEGGFAALIVYAVAFGLVAKASDTFVRNNLLDPLRAVAVAAALGQIIGLTRGEVANFAFVWAFSAATSFMFMALASRVLRSLFGGDRMMQDSFATGADSDDDYDEDPENLYSDGSTAA